MKILFVVALLAGMVAGCATAPSTTADFGMDTDAQRIVERDLSHRFKHDVDASRIVERSLDGAK
jgi:hypothetical protein